MAVTQLRPDTNIRHLIHEDGDPFSSSELQMVREQLNALNDGERTEYRNHNADSIAKHPAARILIVSGPGTGKSHLFLDRIRHWYQNDSDARIVVTTFVRKLVADLESDILNDPGLSDQQRSGIEVRTLHGFARSIVEKNHGTSEWRFRPHFRIIGQSWEKVVWGDVLAYHSYLDRSEFAWESFEKQLHNNEFIASEEWQKLRQTYFELCKFYNASGYADLILRAKTALEENPLLNGHGFFIIDEYQDFNKAEDQFIHQLANSPSGLIVVGDDEQVLYEKLKSGQAALIRGLYNDQSYANAMLPFCGRSSYHITESAAHFIQQHRDSNCIDKVYLPLNTNGNAPKVQVVACAQPSTAVDYIDKFVLDNKNEIDERKAKLSSGEAKDAFLLILTPTKDVKFYKHGKAKDKIYQIVSDYQTENRAFSEDYYRILNYYSLAKNPQNNFTFRKVLSYEDFTVAKTHELIVGAIRSKQNLCGLDSEEVKQLLNKCDEIKDIIETESLADKKVDALSKQVSITDRERLIADINKQAIGHDQITRLEHGEEEEAELEEIQIRKMCAVELVTIVGSKGLSADHVIIIGFDDVNMKYVTKNAFYVAMTRARKSLHILTALKSGAKGPHSFLGKLPETHVEFYKYTKSNHSKTALRGRQGFCHYLTQLNNHSNGQ